MNYLGSISKTINSMKQKTNPPPSPDDIETKQPDEQAPPPPEDYETDIVDCTSCMSSGITSSSFTEAPTTRLLLQSHQQPNPFASYADMKNPEQTALPPPNFNPNVMEHIEERGHRTHHPHHNSVIGLGGMDGAAAPDVSSSMIRQPCNSHRALPRGCLLLLKWEEEQFENGNSIVEMTEEDEILFLEELLDEEKSAYFVLKERVLDIERERERNGGVLGGEYANFIRPTRWEIRNMSCALKKYDLDFIWTRYVNRCNWIINEVPYGYVPYWQVFEELRKGYYTMAGDDLHGCPIIVLEQSRVDGDVDHMIRTKLAITLCRAVTNTKVSYARQGMSMFVDFTNVGWANISLKFQRSIYGCMREIFYYVPGFMCLYQTPTLVRWAFKLSKPFLSDHYREMGNRVLAKNDNSGGRFDWFANADQLPVRYGGSYVATPERDLVTIVEDYLVNCGVSRDEFVPP